MDALVQLWLSRVAQWDLSLTHTPLPQMSFTHTSDSCQSHTLTDMEGLTTLHT